MQLGCVKCGEMFELGSEAMEAGTAVCPHCGTRYRARRPELQTPPSPTTPLPGATLGPTTAMPPAGPPAGERHSGTNLALGAFGNFSPDDMVAGRYRVVRFVAQGGMGEVYEVTDLEIGENVALKTLRPQMGGDEIALERLRRETQLARRVTHPSVSRLFDVGYHRTALGDLPFLTMEFLRGETLAERLLREGRMTPQQALPIARQIAAGLAAAHKAGVVHRDLKGANVFLCPDASEPSGTRAVVTDFGIARTREDQTRLTTAGSVLGTPAYMAPEQLMDGEVTPKTDVYAFGLVLYEMVTGRLPFQSETAISTALRRLTQPPEPPRSVVPDLPRRWEQVILRCLEGRPDDRFADPVQAVEALENSRSTVVIPTRVARRRRVWLYVLAALFLVAAGTAALRIRGLRQAGQLASSGPRKAVVVLGFHNATGRSEVAWMGTALAEMLATELGASGGLRITPPDAVARARRELGLTDSAVLGPEQVARVRDNLGADYLVVGSYTAVGATGASRVRLDLRLLDAAGGTPILSVAEDGAEAALFTLVGDLGDQVRNRLGVSARGGIGSLFSPERWTPEATRLYAEGLARLRAYDAAGAREALEKAVAADPESPHAHGALSEAWTALGYPARARDEAQRAFDLAKNLAPAQRLSIEARLRETVGDWSRAAELYAQLFTATPDDLAIGLRLAVAQASAGQFSEADATIAALRQLPPPAGADPRIAIAATNSAGARGDFRRQLSEAQTAARGGEAIGARLLVAQARVAEAWAQRSLGKPDAAEAAADAARRIYADHGDRGGETQALLAQASAAFDRGDLTRSAELSETALGRAQEVSDSTGVASALNLLAVTVRNQGDLKRARELYERALTTTRETGDRGGEASILGNLATVLVQEGQLASAGGQLETAMTIWRELGDESGQASVHNLQGLVLERQGSFDKSLASFEQALALRKKSGQRSGALVATVGLGRVLLARGGDGDLATAAARFDEALTGCRETSSKTCESRALSGSGELALAAGDLAKARAQVETALAARQAAGELLAAAESRLSLGDVLIDDGQARDALVEARNAAQVFTAQGAKDLAALARALEVRAALATGTAADREAARRVVTDHATAWSTSESPAVRATGILARARVRAASGASGASGARGASSAREAAQLAASAAALPAIPRSLALEARRLRAELTNDRAELAAVRAEAKRAGFGRWAG